MRRMSIMMSSPTVVGCLVALSLALVLRTSTAMLQHQQVVSDRLLSDSATDVAPHKNSNHLKDCYQEKSRCGSYRFYSIDSLKKMQAKQESLKDCCVIEGDLQLILLEKFTSWDNITFPRLVEITGFLLVYRVYNLTSLGKLFPNLATIRGLTTLQGYSLVLSENRELKEVGLYNLTSILNGYVRIQYNINLCYDSTINWNKICKAKDSDKKNWFSDSYGWNCPPCPEKCTSGFCWSNTTCQPDCSESCGGDCVPTTGECCHDQCAGGCTEPDNKSKCISCKNYNHFDGEECVETCPQHNYRKLFNYICIADVECENKGYKFLKGHKGGQCVKECPSGYTANGTDCEICEGNQECGKTCGAAVVNTIEKAQTLKSCTKIDGALVISLTGGRNITEKLEEALANIEEVTQYISIFNSKSLLSLNFFKSLTIIGGEQLVKDKYALYVHDNDNLEHLWENESTQLSFGKGEMFFHSNPKLCYKYIEKLIDSSDLTVDNSTKEIMANINGHKVACNHTSLKLEIDALDETGTLKLTLTTFVDLPDHRVLLGYTVYYQRAETENLTRFGGRDACSQQWSSILIDKDTETYPLRGLIPATRYGIYVQTETLAQADIAGWSTIMYEITLPSNPGEVEDLKVIKAKETSLELAWSLPKRPNGVIKYYIITVTRRPWPGWSFPVDKDNKCPIYDKNEANHEDGAKDDSEQKQTESNNTEVEEDQSCCQCRSSKVENQEQAVDFEDELITLVYFKDKEFQRQKREVWSQSSEEQMETSTNFEKTKWSHVKRSTYIERPQCSIPKTLQNYRRTTVRSSFRLTNEVYTNDLANSSSTEFTTLKARVENQFGAALTQELGSGFESIVVNGFTNGSVIVDSDITLTEQTQGNAIETVSNAIISSGVPGLDTSSVKVLGSCLKPCHIRTENTNVIINDLQHSTPYYITVEACQHINESCSLCTKLPKTHNATTSHKKNADLVQNLKISVPFNGELGNITWDAPKSPNGPIIGYRLQISNDRPWCVNSSVNFYRIPKLSSGDYWFQVEALLSQKEYETYQLYQANSTFYVSGPSIVQSDGKLLLLGIGAAALAFLCLLLYAIWRFKDTKPKNYEFYETMNDNYGELLIIINSTDIDECAGDETPGHNAYMAIQNDPTTYWYPTGLEKHYNNWFITFNFKDIYRVSTINLKNYGDTIHDVKEFKLETSNDHLNWNFVYSENNVRAGTKELQKFGTRTTTCGQFWKFTVTATVSGEAPKLVLVNFYGCHISHNMNWVEILRGNIDPMYIHDRDKLTLDEKKLGKGHFGVVKRGTLKWKGREVEVAVKQLTDFRERESLIQEAKIMLGLECNHVVRTYGVVPEGLGLYLVMDLMIKGDLREYLQSKKVEDNNIFTELTLDRVCDMAVQIADGMAYLAFKKIVHRDLAARNCLLDEKENVKISDFGMTRIVTNYYKIQEPRKIPVRWMPPEILQNSYFTSQSDVWSYGIVVYEIVTGGCRPYKDLQDDAVVSYIKKGGTLKSEMPLESPKFLVNLVSRCWNFGEHYRPSFPEIIYELLPYTSPCFQMYFRTPGMSFYQSSDGRDYKAKMEAEASFEDDSHCWESCSGPTTPLTATSRLGILTTKLSALDDKSRCWETSHLGIVPPKLPPRNNVGHSFHSDINSVGECPSDEDTFTDLPYDTDYDSSAYTQKGHVMVRLDDSYDDGTTSSMFRPGYAA